MEYVEKRYKISDLITKLQEIKESEGDLDVCVSHEHEYWGEVYSYLTDFWITVTKAQPDWPKSFNSIKALVFKLRWY